MDNPAKMLRNAAELAFKEIEQFHSAAYPDCKPDGVTPVAELCPAHEAMEALKEAMAAYDGAS